MTFEEFENNVIEWAKEKDLLHYENHEKQYLKFVEEKGELARGIIKNDTKLIIDSIGDVAVTLVIYRQQCIEVSKQIDVDTSVVSLGESVVSLIKWIEYKMVTHNHNYSFDYSFLFACLNNIAIKLNLTFEQCLEAAWNEIKNRKGKTVNGTFIKEEKQECCLDSGQPCKLECINLKGTFTVDGSKLNGVLNNQNITWGY